MAKFGDKPSGDVEAVEAKTDYGEENERSGSEKSATPVATIVDTTVSK